MLADTGAWHEYQQGVWRATDAFIASLAPDAPETRNVMMKTIGASGGMNERTLWELLYGCVGHGYRHVGEIEFARGVQGLPGLA